MTDYHRANMAKHIKFLEDNADRIRASFDMSWVKHSCGSPSCSLGYVDLSIGRLRGEGTNDLSIRVFGIPWSYSNTDKSQFKISQYMFSAYWTRINNTPEAAAARMKAVLFNQVPKNWEFTEEYAHPVILEAEDLIEVELQTETV